MIINIKSSSAGFSLIELMIVTAGLIGVSTLGMYVQKLQAKSIAKSNFESDMLLITNEINSFLSDQAKCMSSIGGKNAISTLTGIDSINSKYFTIASGGSPAGGYGNSNVSIDSYNIQSTAAEVGANNSVLSILFQNKEILKGTSGPATVTRKINLYVEVDGADNITKCRSLSNSTVDIWSRGVGNDIFYNLGNVGVGTAAPRVKLDITQGQLLTSMDNDWNLQTASSFSNDPVKNSVFLGLRGRGMESAPSYPQSGDTLAGFAGRDATDGRTAAQYGGAEMYVVATENMSAASKGSALYFTTTNNGTNSPVERMRINSNGNIGIGTTNPTGQLHISNIDTNIWINNSFGPPVYYDFVTDGGSDSIFFFNNIGDVGGYTSFAYKNTALLSVMNNGNVGIGTQDPKAKLDVRGGIMPGDQNQVVTCNNETEGTQRYNKLTHSMEYCGYSAGPIYSWRSFANTSNLQRGTVSVPGVSTNTTCVTISFSTAFSNSNYTVSLTPYYQDYGSTYSVISTGYRNKNLGSFEACFDHNGFALTNGFDVDWVAIGN